MLLALTTATDACAAALWDGGTDGRIVAETALYRGQEHAARLVPMIEQVLMLAGATGADVDAIGLAAGPGSYTGLRIGASTAKALALAWHVALVPVPTLDALAEAARPFASTGQTLATLLPSRRGEVYAAAYVVPDDPAEALREVAPASALAVADVPAWREALPAETATVGSGRHRLAEPWPALDGAPDEPTASAVARLAARALAEGRLAAVAAWEPVYLKPWTPGG